MKKARFECHEFIKLNEVRQIVQDSVDLVYEKIAKRDKMIQANNATIRLIETRFKSVTEDIIDLKKMDKQIRSVHKHMKKLQDDLNEKQVTCTNANLKFEVKATALENSISQMVEANNFIKEDSIKTT